MIKSAYMYSDPGIDLNCDFVELHVRLFQYPTPKVFFDQQLMACLVLSENQ